MKLAAELRQLKDKEAILRCGGTTTRWTPRPDGTDGDGKSPPVPIGSKQGMNGTDWNDGGNQPTVCERRLPPRLPLEFIAVFIPSPSSFGTR